MKLIVLMLLAMAVTSCGDKPKEEVDKPQYSRHTTFMNRDHLFLVSDWDGRSFIHHPACECFNKKEINE